MSRRTPSASTWVTGTRTCTPSALAERWCGAAHPYHGARSAARWGTSRGRGSCSRGAAFAVAEPPRGGPRPRGGRRQPPPGRADRRQPAQDRPPRRRRLARLASTRSCSPRSATGASEPAQPRRGARPTRWCAPGRCSSHVRGAVKACGAALPSCTAAAFHRKTAEPMRPAAAAGGGNRRADRYRGGRAGGRGVVRGSPRDPGAAQVTGVGPITALTFVLTRGPGALRRTVRWGPTSGSCRGSASQEIVLGIGKSGDAGLRRLLVRPRTTSSVPSDPIPICADATRRSGTRRSEQSWPSRGGWRCCCSRCGRAGRSTSRCVTPSAREAA